jgi:hypothetical protein
MQVASASERLLAGDAQDYQITLKRGGFSDVPSLCNLMYYF